MLGRFVTNLTERARCAKHNVLDAATFSISFRDGCYHVRTEDGTCMRFSQNVYAAFLEVTEGYLPAPNWHLHPGMCVIDAGACHGEFALYASHRVGPAGRVLAVEPDTANCERMMDTFAVNGGVPKNVSLIREGLWRDSREISLAGGQGLASRVAPPGATRPEEGEPRTVTIRTCSIPDLVRRHNLDRLDFVKMDIEGSELEAVEGVLELLSALRPKFAIASYHQRDGRLTAGRLEEIFRSVGYRATTGYPRHLTTYAEPENHEA
jgi:FkbM family methyltransferase